MTTIPPKNSTATRTLYGLFAANAISLTGNRLTMLAVPWFVLVTTGSAAQTGITAFFTLLPTVIAAFFGGVVIDRLGYRRSSIVSDLASGITVLLIPLLYHFGLLPFWLLLALVFLGELMDTPGATARAALLPELAEAAQMPLERAAALSQVVDRGAGLLGAPLAGVLVALIGAQNVLWFDAATFAVSALLIALAIPKRHALKRFETKQTGIRRYTTELLDGLRFLYADRLLLSLLFVVTITNFLDAALSAVILPVYAREVYGNATALGLMFGLGGGGAVVGALLYSAVGHRYSRRWVLLGAYMAITLPRLALLFFPPLIVTLSASFLVGVAAGPLNPILSTIEYERIPVAMRGRVFGTITALVLMAAPFGVMLAGYLVEWTSLWLALLIVNLCYLLTTSSLLFNSTLHGMDEQPENKDSSNAECPEFTPGGILP